MLMYFCYCLRDTVIFNVKQKSPGLHAKTWIAAIEIHVVKIDNCLPIMIYGKQPASRHMYIGGLLTGLHSLDREP